MVAKTIVTFHPDVACDLCGRRLLRGERPEVFLGGGQRRMVCELCAPRANHEGWRREVEEQIVSPRAPHVQRSRSLLGRLRQLREPVRAPNGGAIAGSGLPRESRREGAAPPIEWAGIGREWTEAEEDGTSSQGPRGMADDGTGGGAAETAELGYASERAEFGYAAGDALAGPAGAVAVDADTEVQRALDIFNIGETPRRVAGVARSLGPACVRAAPIGGVGGGVAIVVAWELCWYRYEIDTDDEAAGVRIAAEGMELEELAAEERLANAAADEHGMLSLLAN